MPRRESQSSEATTESYRHYAEEASHEQYSGPISESVPSSYSAFHHRRYSRSVLSRTSSNASLDTLEDHQSEVMVRRRERSDSRSSFKFFTSDEIEQAEGGSTANDMDPMDYEEYVSDDYENETIFPNPHQHPNRYHYESRYSIDDDEGEHMYSTEEEPRRRRRSSNFSSSTTEEPLLDHHTADLENLDHPFTSNAKTYTYPSSERTQQRFYISEEDMMVVFGGYKTSKWRLMLYYMLCCCTFGMAYLVLRWFPRLRISCIGYQMTLGECDWVVIENQWGELDIIDVERARYNRPLSSVFPMHSKEAEEAHASDDDYDFDPDPDLHTLRWFLYRYIKFMYNPLDDLFSTNQTWADPEWNMETAQLGLDSDVQQDREMVFGENLINIEEKPTMKLLVDEVLHPFYVFQVFSIILWSCDEYYYYAGCIFLISVISVGNTLVETKQTLHRLREIAKFSCDVRVKRNSFWKTISSTELVPGDVYEVSDPSLTLLPCDSLLLTGDCIVNESMLTGESVPVSKLPADEDTFYHMLKHDPEQGVNVSPEVARHYLYSGTRIIRVRPPTRSDLDLENEDPSEDEAYDVALAMVVKTGFLTTKGSLVRSMLFPKPSGFKFYRDSFRYIGVMAAIAALGFIVSTVNFIKMHMPTRLIVLRALDLITVVVPPALPATLTIGTNISLSRLKSKSIFCISPNRVNVGGKLDVVCFDKTGTLTEDGLDVLGVRVIDNEQHQFGDMLEDISDQQELVSALATCHSLRSIDDELMGDPLDEKMFHFTGWQFEEAHGGVRFGIVRCSYSPDGVELETMKTFEFVSQLRRMSVLVRDRMDASNVKVFVKGAPEAIAGICSTELPKDYYEQLQQYTHRGYRVIACATKTYENVSSDEVEELTRGAIESELRFIGFIVFENKLKPSTAGVIQQLTDAKIRSIMCTGDNVLTAISVARECHMIRPDIAVFVPHFGEQDDLQWECIDDADLVLDSGTLHPTTGSSKEWVMAVTGDAFRYIIQCGTAQQLEQMLMHAVIFARMSPDEKHELVENLQSIDYTTGFCGDGANDCGALKAADVGVSLSEAEASVAAPFTSRLFEISCVLSVIKEGRCALATSFSCFKYMSMYSAIQFVTISIMYSLGSNLGDFQFLWIDLFLILPIAIFMAWAKPFEILSRKRPTANLVSRKVLVPLLGEIVLFGGFQMVIWHCVRQRPWYKPPLRGGDDSQVNSSDNSALFIYSCFQYIVIAVLLSVGPPYRQPLFKNVPFLVTVGITVSATLVLMYGVDADSSFGQLMNLSYLSRHFKVVMIVVLAINIAVSSLAEWRLFPWLNRVLVAIKRVFGMAKRHSRKRYKVIRQEQSCLASV